MTLLILATAVFCALCAAAHLASIVITIARVRSSTGTGSLPDASEGVSIVRPVCRIENFAAETLGSALVLDYPRYEVLRLPRRRGT